MGSWRPTTRAVFLVLLAITTKQRKMEKFQSEEFKQNFERNEKGYSIIQAVLGGIMIAIGHLWADECPNDAAYWLFVAGICLVVLKSSMDGPRCTSSVLRRMELLLERSLE